MLTDETPAQTGVVKTLLRAKGFGFVRGAAGEYFFHVSDCVGGGATFRSLEEGMAVSFTVVASAKGPRAATVQPA